MDWTTIGAAAGGVAALVKAGYVAATGFSETNVTWVNGRKHVDNKEPWAGPELTALFYAAAGVLLLIGATHTPLGHTIRVAEKTKDGITDKIGNVEFLILGPFIVALLAFMVAAGLGLAAEGIRDRTPGVLLFGLVFVCVAAAMTVYVGASWFAVAFG